MIPQWTDTILPCDVVKDSDVVDPKGIRMFIDENPMVVIQHFGISADGQGRLDPLVVAHYQEGMVIPGPPFWWPLTWQRYLAMAQLGKKPGQQMEERTTVFESWEQNKDFIMTKEPRWLGGHSCDTYETVGSFPQKIILKVHRKQRLVRKLQESTTGKKEAWAQIVFRFDAKKLGERGSHFVKTPGADQNLWKAVYIDLLPVSARNKTFTDRFFGR